MSAAARCTDLNTLARYLGFAPQHLFYLVALGDKLYTQIRIPKKSGRNKFRNIQIPNTELKGVQRAILKYILAESEIDRHAWAYVRGKSVVQAASKLCGKKSVLKIDLTDFFPSISIHRVFGLFGIMGFNINVSWILTRLCIFDDALAQGAPTSPYISNLICRRLDDNLSRLAHSWGLSYLRYSDDIYFYSENNFQHRSFGNYVKKIIGENGFRINRKKTKYHPIGKPRFTLGLATHNAAVALPRQTRRNYRAAFFKASRNIKWARENIDRLSGMAEWYRSVYGRDERYIEYRNVIENVRHLRLHEPFAT